MRILHLSAQKPDSTGSGIYLAQTAAALARLGAEQVIVAGIAPADNPEIEQGIRFEPVFYDSAELPFPVLGMSNVMPYPSTRYCDLTEEMVGQFKEAFGCKVREVLVEFQPDLIICHHLYLLCALTAAIVDDLRTNQGLLRESKLVGMCHGTCLRQMRQHDLEREFIIRGIRNLDAVFALHADQAKEIVSVYGVDQDCLSVVGTGYSAALFNSIPRGVERDRGGIVFVGKVSFAKGALSLMRAMGLLAKDGVDCRLRVVGGHGDQEEFEAIEAAAKASGASVDLLGRVDESQLVDEYHRANVFVLPSFYEGLPLVVVEALACGCKVVVTDLPGVKPWLSQALPDAAIGYVDLPRLRDVDAPVEEDLPRFEANLAQALKLMLASEQPACDTTGLSWDGLAARMVGCAGFAGALA